MFQVFPIKEPSLRGVARRRPLNCVRHADRIAQTARYRRSKSPSWRLVRVEASASNAGRH